MHLCDCVSACSLMQFYHMCSFVEPPPPRHVTIPSLQDPLVLPFPDGTSLLPHSCPQTPLNCSLSPESFYFVNVINSGIPLYIYAFEVGFSSSRISLRLIQGAVCISDPFPSIAE